MQRLRKMLLISTGLMPLALAAAIAGPDGGRVVSGSATINNPGSANVSVNQQSDRAIINWRMFDIGPGEKTTFVQPNTNSVVLNRVTGGLAAGNTFSLDFYGDKLITLGVGDQIATQVKDVVTGQTLKALVTNDGKLKANGGRVELTAAAARQVVDAVINTSGVIEANTVGTRNGQIVLSAATRQPGLPKQTVKVSGKLTATASGDDTSVPANAPTGKS